MLAGGLVGGILGPSTSRFTVDLLQPRFTGAYLALIGFALATLVVLRFVRIPPLDAKAQAARGRPLSEIARQPKFVIAVTSGAIGYGVMNFLMTSTPIAMGVCGHPYGDAAFVISSHVIAMFLPSFVTGNLIRRFGVLQVMFVGALLNPAGGDWSGAFSSLFSGGGWPFDPGSVIGRILHTGTDYEWFDEAGRGTTVLVQDLTRMLLVLVFSFWTFMVWKAWSRKRSRA